MTLFLGYHFCAGKFFLHLFFKQNTLGSLPESTSKYIGDQNYCFVCFRFRGGTGSTIKQCAFAYVAESFRGSHYKSEKGVRGKIVATAVAQDAAGNA